jgi:hypothetical protein
MKDEFPKVGDILITTPKHFEWNGYHAIAEVVSYNRNLFFAKIIISTDLYYIGKEKILVGNAWSDLFVNIS